MNSFLQTTNGYIYEFSIFRNDVLLFLLGVYSIISAIIMKNIKYQSGISTKLVKIAGQKYVHIEASYGYLAKEVFLVHELFSFRTIWLVTLSQKVHLNKYKYLDFCSNKLLLSC